MNSLVRLSVKDLGAYYTPQTIAGILAEWVVQTGAETLLEPSIGDGALLRAALARAERKSPGSSRLHFIGCDIDDEAITEVRSWLASRHALLAEDFLEVDPEIVPRVDGVISNPPFTRNHALSKKRREELRQRFAVKGAAGLWVHFLLHAMDFIAPGGRMAAVVPAAAMFTEYGREALKRICEKFEHVEIRQIVDRPLWSSHAEERGAIVLARNFGAGPCELPSPSRWSAEGDRLADNRDDNPLCFQQALASASHLADLATLSIGAVTGYNKVFLMSEAERLAAQIDVEDLSIVAARGRHLKGLSISVEELCSLAQSGERTWMLTPQDIAKARRGVRNRLARIPADLRRSVVWLNKRSPWWKVDTGPACDAVFTYMNDCGPRIVIAENGVRCTNTLHRIRFGPEINENDRLVAALSMISSFGQLAAERVGRFYGGGVLKFELTEARRFPVLMRAGTPAKSAFEAADRAMRAGETEAARRVADALLLPTVFGDLWESAGAEMMSAAIRLRSLRRAGPRS